jgi:hypothetical protein
VLNPAAMKTSTLTAFAVVMLLGWTALAAGVIGVFAGHPLVTAPAHSHVQSAPVVDAPLLLSETPCEARELDASVRCST